MAHEKLIEYLEQLDKAGLTEHTTLDDFGIVRCRDCKYFMDGNGCILQSIDYEWEEQMVADDFCSRGELK